MLNRIHKATNPYSSSKRTLLTTISIHNVYSHASKIQSVSRCRFMLISATGIIRARRYFRTSTILKTSPRQTKMSKRPPYIMNVDLMMKTIRSCLLKEMRINAVVNVLTLNGVNLLIIVVRINGAI